MQGKGFSRCRTIVQRASKVHSWKTSLLGEDSGTHCVRVEVGNEVDKWAGVRRKCALLLRWPQNTYQIISSLSFSPLGLGRIWLPHSHLNCSHMDSDLTLSSRDHCPIVHDSLQFALQSACTLFSKKTFLKAKLCGTTFQSHNVQHL